MILPRATVLACGLALLAGCSAVRLGYTELDNIALWTAERYFDLDEQQKKNFRTRFYHLHKWHRDEQLPDYAAFLEQAKARLERGLRAEDVHWFLEGIRQRYVLIVNRGADDAAAILLSVTPGQLVYVQKRWDELNQRFASDNRLGANLEERREARAQRSIKRFRDWFGDLSDEQEHFIRAHVASMEMIGALRQVDRMRRQHEFMQLMELRAQPEIFKDELRLWLINWDAGRSPEYQRSWIRWRDQNIAMLIAVDRSLTVRQRARAAQKLQGYIDDFRSLSKRSGVHAAVTQ